MEVDIRHMRLAIREARRSRAEDAAPRPHVGVVVVRENEVLATACRGDLAPGDHAEFGVLEKKLATEKLAGCTIYTTLEPCTTRNHLNTSERTQAMDGDFKWESDDDWLVSTSYSGR